MLSTGWLSFQVFKVPWWLARLHINEVKYTNYLFEFIITMSFFFSKSFKIVHFICHPGSIWNCFLNLIYNWKILQHPTSHINIQLSMDNIWIDPWSTSVLYPNYINACMHSVCRLSIISRRPYIYYADIKWFQLL